MQEKMPKYSLDARGILTITDETDGGIFSVAVWFKKVALIISIISMLVVSILYFTKYITFTDADYLKSVLENQFSSMDVSSSFSVMLSKLDVSYPFTTVAKNAKGQPDFYMEVFNIVADKAEDLFNTVLSTIQSIIS